MAEDPIKEFLKKISDSSATGTQKTSASSQLREKQQELLTMKASIDDPAMFGIDGFGSVERVLFGAGKDEDDIDWKQNLARGALGTFGGERGRKAVRSMGSREVFKDKFFEEAAAMLQGSGSVSNFERQAALSAIQKLGRSGTTSVDAAVEIDRLLEAINLLRFRENSGITVDPTTGVETRMVNGVAQTGVSLADANGFMVFKTLKDPTKTIVNIPKWVWDNDDMVTEELKSIPPDALVAYKGGVRPATDVFRDLGIEMPTPEPVAAEPVPGAGLPNEAVPPVQ